MIESIPFFHSYNIITQRLTLRWADCIPDEVFQFVDKIKILDITGWRVSELPMDFPLLRNLFAVFLWENNFKEFPQILAQCKNLKVISFKNGALESIPEYSFPENLEWLVLTNNPCIKEIPSSIWYLGNLKKLALTGTSLCTLPNSLLECKNLEFLRISACNFMKVPNWIYEFPRLAWFSDAGNPLSLQNDVINNASCIPESDIQIFECINESNISRVSRWKIISTGKDIVIKDYINTITSDGYAADDIAASIAIGDHPNIITAIGVMRKAQDDNAICLVSGLIPSWFRKLWLPPTLESCARDTYDANSSFPISSIINTLLDISAACEHIHMRWISHGDLYAHNILVDNEGHAILTDFWAATFHDPSMNPVYEYYDVCAFWHLMSELIERVNDVCMYSEDMVTLLDIKNTCISENILSRPKFSEINKRLRNI